MIEEIKFVAPRDLSSQQIDWLFNEMFEPESPELEIYYLVGVFLFNRNIVNFEKEEIENKNLNYILDGDVQLFIRFEYMNETYISLAIFELDPPPDRSGYFGRDDD